MLKGLVVAACVSSVGFMWTFSASATPIDTTDDVTEITGHIITGHEDAILFLEPDPFVIEVTTLTGYTVPGSYDQFYIPTDGELMAGNDCSTSDDIDELLFALILELDDLWLFLA